MNTIEKRKTKGLAEFLKENFSGYCPVFMFLIFHFLMSSLQGQQLTHLICSLSQIDKRYKQYYHQMQTVVSFFDNVAGHGAAEAYTALARKTISQHFRCLRDAISERIQAIQRRLGEQDTSTSSLGSAIPRLRYVDMKLRQERGINQLSAMRHAWRPQRGLPESSVTILRAWLFEHFLHPYIPDSFINFFFSNFFECLIDLRLLIFMCLIVGVAI